MDIYTDVTKELKQREFDNLQEKMNQKKYRRKRRGLKISRCAGLALEEIKIMAAPKEA